MPTQVTWASSTTVEHWNQWVTTAGTANVTWDYWTTATTTYNAGPMVTYRVDTAEERTRREREWQSAEEALRAAGARAEETLQSVLTSEQRADWVASQRFELITDAGRRYRICRGVSGNVRLLEEGHEVERLCAHPNRFQDGGQLPVEDVVIAQVLALRSDEEGFRRVANITPNRRAA